MGTDSDWEAWGARDPYFGVVSHQKFHGAGTDDTRAAFFQSGAEFVAMVLEEAEAAFGSLAHESALDFGSGVGRLTRPLTAKFERVTGVDVSPSMRALAAQNCPARFVASLNDVTEPVDFVLSYIVLQHIPPAVGYGIIEKLLALIAPGGVAMLHVSIQRKFGPLKSAVYWAKHSLPGARALFNLLQRKPFSTPLMQMNEYDLERVLEYFARADMRKPEITREDHGGVETVRILAQRENAPPAPRG